MAPTSALCSTLEVSRSGYYKWLAGTSAKTQSDEALVQAVTHIYWAHRRRYGARRIVEELHDMGIECGRKKVRKVMKQRGFQAIQPKSFKPRGTESRHRLGYNDNLLIDRQITRQGEAWVGDITFVPCADVRFCYLAVLMDLYSRRIVGWSLRDDMKEELVVAALTQSIRDSSPAVGLIHHSDRGGQYAGKRYRSILSRARLIQSMSRANNCYDNAFMESCFGTIKTELEMSEYKNVKEARRDIASFISYYNHRRKHSALGYRTPAQFEAECN